MKSHTAYLTMNVPARMDFVNITREVENAVAETQVQEGLCLSNAMHITASVFINDDEPGLHQAYKAWLEKLAPFDPSPPLPSQPHLVRTTGTRTTSARSWAARWWWRSPRGSSTSGPESRSSTVSSTAADPSGF